MTSHASEDGPAGTIEEQLAAEREKSYRLGQECERLAALAEERFSDVRLVKAGPSSDGGFAFDLTGGPVSYIAEYLAQMLGHRDEASSNYVEMEVIHREFGPLTLTLQRRSGLTPHQKAQVAIDQARQLEEQLQPLRNGADRLMSHLDSALNLLVRRINGGADDTCVIEWLRLNHPKKAKLLQTPSDN